MEGKFLPQVGDKLYLSQRTGMTYVDLVRTPYTVIAVKSNVVTIQAAKCIFPEPRYYDTLPISIEEDKSGEILELHWSNKKQKWQVDKYKTGYPDYAFFGKWDYYPYLD